MFYHKTFIFIAGSCFFTLMDALGMGRLSDVDNGIKKNWDRRGKK